VIVPGLKCVPDTVTDVPARAGFGDSLRFGPLDQHVGVGLGGGVGLGLVPGLDDGVDCGPGEDPELGREVGLDAGLGEEFGPEVGLEPGRGDSDATPLTTRSVVCAWHWPLQQIKRM
jgi:hypothetical protein